MKLDFGPRDLCPLGHGPMWWTASDGAWACQQPRCEVTRPVTQREVMMRQFVETNSAMRQAFLAMPSAGLFRIVSTS